jgi:hypothetical protein
MEEAYEILEYLPIRLKEQTEQEYIDHLWDSFQSNYKNQKYQFAFLAYHLLFMSFIYFTIWKIKTHRKEDFDNLEIGFDGLPKATKPFSLSIEKEAKIIDLLQYICPRGQNRKAIVGNYKKLVQERNDIAHANGNIPFKTEDYLYKQVSKILEYTKEIHEYSKPIIHECFKSFLLSSQDEEIREYPDMKEQINEILIHENYLSKRDLVSFLDCSIPKSEMTTGFDEIKKIAEDYKEELII